MKRLTAMLLVLLLLLGTSGASADGTQAPLPEDLDILRIANPTPLTGEFFTDLWGNGTSDADIRDFLHGYNLILWDSEAGAFNVNPEVADLVCTENESGDKSYIFVLKDDLYYSDGSKITARDYAFSILLEISPEMEAAGGVRARKDHLLGCEEYLAGETRYLAGVRLVAEDTLMLTLDHEYLPFFYEMGLLRCLPYPAGVIAPGVGVRDDGQGVYLANLDDAVTEPLFTAALLEKTLNDPETGYRSHPQVVSGPYTLSSWDGETAVLSRNPLYKGNPEKETGSFRTVTYTLAEKENMMEKLADGELDVINKVTGETEIRQGMALVGAGQARMANYPRVGLSFLSFARSHPALSSANVRKAIAWSMDRDEITRLYTGGFGQRVDGFYGLGQWMSEIVSGTLEPPVDPPEDENNREAMEAYEKELAEWESLNLDGLTSYSLDTDRARALLEEDGWTLGNDGLRHKNTESGDLVLDLSLYVPEGTGIDEIFRELLVPNLAEIGIRLTVSPVPMKTILREYYGHEGQEADMVFLASNYDPVYDPSVTFATEGEEGRNRTGIAQNDEELYRLSVELRKTEPGDILGYLKKWVAFEERYNEALPVIPLYSNVYFDFTGMLMQDYAIAEHMTVAAASEWAWKGLDEEEEEVWEEEGFFSEDGDELVEFEEF